MDKINLEPALSFLTDISHNNNKTWFEQNRRAYDAAMQSFSEFVDALIDEFRVENNLQDLTAKDCISRIYRDLRFSKDKSPYKTNLWATIAPGGKKSMQMHMGYHVAIQPQGKSILAGGLYEPSPEQLNGFRQAIDEDAQEFKQVISKKAFVDYFGGIGGDKLKKAPQGYELDHPEIELLKLKQIVVMRSYTDAQVLGNDFLGLVITGCRVMRPFLEYFQRFS